MKVIRLMTLVASMLGALAAVGCGKSQNASPLPIPADTNQISIQ